MSINKIYFRVRECASGLRFGLGSLRFMISFQCNFLDDLRWMNYCVENGGRRMLSMLED